MLLPVALPATLPLPLPLLLDASEAVEVAGAHAGPEVEELHVAVSGGAALLQPVELPKELPEGLSEELPVGLSEELPVLLPMALPAALLLPLPLLLAVAEAVGVAEAHAGLEVEGRLVAVPNDEVLPLPVALPEELPEELPVEQPQPLPLLLAMAEAVEVAEALPQGVSVSGPFEGAGPHTFVVGIAGDVPRRGPLKERAVMRILGPVVAGRCVKGGGPIAVVAEEAQAGMLCSVKQRLTDIRRARMTRRGRARPALARGGGAPASLFRDAPPSPMDVGGEPMGRRGERNGTFPQRVR